MNSAPDIVKVMQVAAALLSFAVIIITRMVSVVIGKLRFPEMVPGKPAIDLLPPAETRSELNLQTDMSNCVYVNACSLVLRIV